MEVTPEVRLPQDSDPNLDKLKNELEGQKEDAPKRLAFRDLLSESKLQIQGAFLESLSERLSRAGASESEQREISDTVAQTTSDLAEVRERIKAQSNSSGDYAKAYALPRFPCQQFIRFDAEQTMKEKPVLRILGRVIGREGGAYESGLIGKYNAITKLEKLDTLTTFVSKLNVPKQP